MGKIREQREEALRKAALAGNGANHEFATDAHVWVKELLAQNSGVNNSGYASEEIEAGVAKALSAKENYFENVGFHSPEEAQKVYDVSEGTLKFAVDILIRDGMADFKNFITELSHSLNEDPAYKTMAVIVKEAADAFVGEIEKKQMMAGTLAQDRHDRELAREHNFRLANRWVDTISEHASNTPHSEEKIKDAVYQGLNKVEFTAGAENNTVMEQGKITLQDHLVILMTEGIEPFIASYRSLIRQDDAASQAAVDGIRVMAHALGINTSLTAEIRKRRKEQEPVRGSQERSR